MYDYAIIGAGIVGLSTGYALLKRHPEASVVVIDKETHVAAHQTGHNSGVMHSGIYYKPNSLKARLAKAGNEAMVSFCEQHNVDYDICGKVIVAANEQERPLLDNLYQRGRQNGLDVQKLTKEQLQEKEPHANGVEAVYVPSAGIVDYKQVSQTFASLIEKCGGKLQLGTEVIRIHEKEQHTQVETTSGSITSRVLINCAGLHSDRIAKMAGYYTDMQIVPFRGEYYQLKKEKRHLVKNLIYPVPNPDFPFLGVHFTRMIDGDVEAGPNAVLGLKREGYRKTDFHPKDMMEVMKYGGFWKLAKQYAKEGANEMIRSLSKKRFVESMQKLIPSITEADVEPGPAGVRAQALREDGSLVDDFHIIEGKRCLHVCNAPSPAATASIPIGEEIASRVLTKHAPVH